MRCDALSMQVAASTPAPLPTLAALPSTFTSAVQSLLVQAATTAPPTQGGAGSPVPSLSLSVQSVQSSGALVSQDLGVRVSGFNGSAQWGAQPAHMGIWPYWHAWAYDILHTSPEHGKWAPAHKHKHASSCSCACDSGCCHAHGRVRLSLAGFG